MDTIFKWYDRHHPNRGPPYINLTIHYPRVSDGPYPYANILSHIEKWYMRETRIEPGQNVCDVKRPRDETQAAIHRLWDVARALRAVHTPWPVVRQVLDNSSELMEMRPPELKPEMARE